MTRAWNPMALALMALPMLGCGGAEGGKTELRFWAMGREGEVVQELVTEFEAQNPDLQVVVQQIPWSAAHEKLLTAFVGRSTPDLAQLGNTWIAEFEALRALEPLAPWILASSVVDSSSYFTGIWNTNAINGRVYGVPWYVDTRVLFYRKDILQAAGYESMPTSWSKWRASMMAIKSQVGATRYAILLPTNEWTQPVLFGLQNGSPLLEKEATRGAFTKPEFTAALEFYLELFADGLAPAVANNEIGNVYQEFARGLFAMYITGPWNLGEFRRRLPEELAQAWGTAPLPGPDGKEPGFSLAGGSSLVMFEASPNKEAAWRLIEFLSRPDIQLRFYDLTGDLPARLESWEDDAFRDDPYAGAFWQQLHRVRATPKIPEWEQIATKVQEHTERAIRGSAPADSAMALLDRDVYRILEKRRWLLARARSEATANDALPTPHGEQP